MNTARTSFYWLDSFFSSMNNVPLVSNVPYLQNKYFWNFSVVLSINSRLPFSSNGQPMPMIWTLRIFQSYLNVTKAECFLVKYLSGGTDYHFPHLALSRAGIAKCQERRLPARSRVAVHPDWTFERTSKLIFYAVQRCSTYTPTSSGMHSASLRIRLCKKMLVLSTLNLLLGPSPFWWLFRRHLRRYLLTAKNHLTVLMLSCSKSDPWIPKIGGCTLVQNSCWTSTFLWCEDL